VDLVLRVAEALQAKAAQVKAAQVKAAQVKAAQAKAAQAKLLRTARIRADTTVVAANVAYPTYSGLPRPVSTDPSRAPPFPFPARSGPSGHSVRGGRSRNPLSE